MKDLEFAGNPFAELNKQCAEIIGETIQRRRFRRVAEALAELTNEERLDLFSAYCIACGKKDRGCQCWNDE